MKCQLPSHVAMGRDVAGADQLTGRKKTNWPMDL